MAMINRAFRGVKSRHLEVLLRRVNTTRRWNVPYRAFADGPNAQNVTVDAEVTSNNTSTAAVEEREIPGQVEKRTFQAETKQLLDIVTHALYTDRHIFIRELISNASDASEKLRHRQSAGEPVVDPTKELSIQIFTDEAANTITFVDHGIGLSHDEMVENLGTIAHSGSKQFLKALQAQGKADGVQGNLIGQFGVGFYSAFMVADEVKVYSMSAAPEQATPHVWRSGGTGEYEIGMAENVTRGSKIVLKLKDNSREFANAQTVEEIIKKYSNFVNFPIHLNGKQVNTVQAVWAMPKSEVTEEMYTDFYKFKARSYDKPLYKLHFMSDAPIELKALFFVGELSDEGFGLGRMRPGVDLYSRRVLIEAESKIMPEWLRFLHGVVDSEDIPLNISRESMQDSTLMRRIRNVLTRRILRFFESELKRDRKQYQKFFQEFGTFLKEGACSEQAYQTDIAKLLMFESSALPAGELTTLDEYISRTRPGQSQVYYLVAPHRGLAEKSPYMEAFKPNEQNDNTETEVLYMYNPIDDFVMNNLHTFNGRKLVTIESSEVKLDNQKEDKEKQNTNEDGTATEQAEKDTSEQSFYGVPTRLTKAMVSELGDWLMGKALTRRLKSVRATSRLQNSPAVITDHESSSLRRMMRMMDAQQRDSESPRAEDNILPKQTLEINPAHPIICHMYAMMHSQPDVARATAEQLFDNAVMAAGLMDDPRGMLPRLNVMMERLLSTVAERDALKKDHHNGQQTSSHISIDDDLEGREHRHVPDSEIEFEAARDVLTESILDAANRAKAKESFSQQSQNKHNSSQTDKGRDIEADIVNER